MVFFEVVFKVLGYNTFFLQGADGLGAELHGDFLTINHESLGLKVRLPNFLGMALRKAHIVAVLFAFTS